MSRIRTVKPGFFLNEDLAELSPFHRLLFIGLWTLADKEGRVEDRPRRIKAALFPWDDVDVGMMLADLEHAGFLVRYESDDVACLWIPTFKEHQRPHPKEAESNLPPPPENTPSRGRKRLSRETSRLAVEEISTIPSCPPGKEISVAGKEVLDNGDGEASATPPVQLHAPALITPPDSPPENWTGRDFWAWAQGRRQEAGLLPERGPPKAVDAWWSRCRMLPGVTTRAVQEAFYVFGEDPYWQRQKPSLPFAAFQSQWERFVPSGAVDAAP